MAKPPVSANPYRELFVKIRFILIAILIYRIGAHIPVPGIDPDKLNELFALTQGTILSLFNVFSGGALERMSILALGIMPYITSSIIMNLMTAAFPYLDQLKKEGESGRKKINQFTRYGTVIIAFFQGLGISVALANQGVVFSADLSFFVVATLSFVAGSVFLMWLGEQVTERGLGNGISILIFVSIASGIPTLIGQSVELARQGDINILLLIASAVFVFLLVAFVVFFERGQRQIRVSYSNRNMSNFGAAAQQSSHVPLKLNMAGVIPAIFASSILLFPASLGQWFGQAENSTWLVEITNMIAPGQPLYNILFAAGVIFFCFFYTSLVFSPKDVADNLRRSNAYLPGIRPGKQTADYIEKVLTRLTVFGSIYITAVALLPQMILVGLDIPFFFAGTSVLIVVVVVMDFITQVQSHLMSQHYGSLLKKANNRR